MLLPRLYSLYRDTGISTRLRRARFDRVEEVLDLQPNDKVLEVGCARGIDFAQFALRKYLYTGVDTADVDRICDFEFRRLDARHLPWPDRHFDAVVSIGVLEHIQPMNVLCEVTSEIRRVGKRFCNIVPSSGTWMEPHTWSLFWHARDRRKKRPCEFELNYFSDEAWLQFPGFEKANSLRYWHAPGIQNLMIYCSASDA
jgi:SAM-dependent methyltransferase